MGKGHRHKKNLKSEKAKVKLKTKTKTNLPKGLNVTDTSFKVKKILIREQLKEQSETEILSRRKRNIKELITSLHHHNSTVRHDAVKELKEILTIHSSKALSSQLHSLLQGISALSLDNEKSVRTDALKALNLILNPISNDQLEPFFEILISYLSCAMTHIDPNIKESSLLFLDVLAKNCGLLLAKNSHKVLPNFLDMISKSQTDMKLGRQLTTSLKSKQTSIKWRINVLSRLGSILSSMINVKKFQNPNKTDLNSDSKIICDMKNSAYIPLLRGNYLNTHQLQLSKDQHGDRKNNMNLEGLKQFTQVLMPLMIESWIEISPKQGGETAQSNIVITNDALSLLSTIMKIMELLIEYVDLFESEWYIPTIDDWFSEKFRNMFEKNIVVNFPYCQLPTFAKLEKPSQNATSNKSSAICLEENMAICHAYIWLLSKSSTNAKTVYSKDVSSRVLQYITDRLEDWSGSDNLALPQLVRCLKCILLRANKAWYCSRIQLGKLLQAIIDVHSKQSRKELRSQLFEILISIIMDHDLTELHSEPALQKFIASLPNCLLKRSIQEDMIRLLHRIVLQHRKWVEDGLRNQYEAIIAHASEIAIIGSKDEKQSRLSICNLFYFIDGQVYY